MIIPDKVKVGGITYKVDQVNKIDNKKKIHGMQTQWEERIQIKKSLPHVYKEKVFVHELVHAIFDFLMWEQDDSTVERLAGALHMVIKDNPTLFNDLVQ